jgi:large subunit ribosomal protein L24
MPARIRKGDLVAVIAGDDKGKRGRVLKVIADKNRVLIEGVNLVYKHLRRSQQNPKGGRVHREAPVHLSNVMPVDPQTNEAARVAYRDGARVARRSGARLEGGAKPGAKRAQEGGE